MALLAVSNQKTIAMKLFVASALGMILLTGCLQAEEIDHATEDEAALKATAVQFFLNLVEENGKDVTQKFEMTDEFRSWMQEEQSIATIHAVLQPFLQQGLRRIERQLPFGRIGELQKIEIVRSPPDYLSVELFYSGTRSPFKARVTFQNNQIGGIHIFPLNAENGLKKEANVLKNMSVMESIIWGITLIPLLIISLYLLNGKGAFLMAGYNTMSRREQAKYDEKAWCRCIGKFTLWITCCVMLLPFAIHSEDIWMPFVVAGIIMVSVVVALIYVGTGKRFLKKGDAEEWVAEESEEEKALYAKLEAKREKIGLWVMGYSVFILLAVMFAVPILLLYGELEPTVTITDNSIRISGVYGVKIDIAEITDIFLMEDAISSIGLTMRTNGYGTDSTQKGYFRSNRYGSVLLFTRTNSSPTIHIQREGKEDIFLNFSNNEATRTLYHDLTTAFAR
ncbi:MAG: DUF3784 domain-containing protein [Planctomycetaceae bacterium]|nr:DUF3784 domain-containing protein [Planctomycetaceae bacterium]